jgi:Arc/MetJ-type ribon-helix-helix transcriptional regulator
MNLNLSSETEAWLRAQVESGQFASYEDAIDYSVRFLVLKQALEAAIADPRRLTVDEVKTRLAEKRIELEEQGLA